MTRTPVLYVEDEENDAFLVQLGFERAGVAIPLSVVTDGQQAIEYLSGTGRYADRQKHPLPCLVLLDLNLPLVSGFEVLRWIRAEAALQDLPVVIFSSSSQPGDQARAREFGATDYEVKPVDMAQMASFIRKLDEKWLRQACASVSR